MIYPKLDKRTVNDIISEIKKKSEFYTPEWRFDPEDMDAGGALSRIYAEMMYETIDRVNRFPDKCYLEFLNMQGVCAKPVSPAVGMATAQLVDGAPGAVVIPKGTQLFTDVAGTDGEDRRVVFETVSTFAATPARAAELYMTDPERDVITRTDLNGTDELPISLFAPDAKNNIECHRFTIANDAVLRLVDKSEIRVKLAQTGMAFRSAEDLKRLADPEFAHWSYTDGAEVRELSASVVGGSLVLKKNDGFAIAKSTSEEVPDEEGGRFRIFCDMKAQKGDDDITADNILLNCRSKGSNEGGILPDCIFAGDTELDPAGCGYGFGKEPSAYDSMYISCGEAFSKRGADITLEFDVRTVTVLAGEDEEETIDFNKKLLVDKADAKKRPRDDISISDIVWEYWNGYGFARLEVEGDINPFSCKDASERKHVRFTCPDDFAPSMQNAHEGLWLRARIREVENRFSTHARWLLPYIRRMGISFDYGDNYLQAEEITATNNVTELTYVPNGSKMSMRLFGLMPEAHHAVYLRFDEMPSGYPINLYFEFIGRTGVPRVLGFEYLAGERGGRAVWSELKTTDRTQSFENSGIVSLYNPGDFCEADIFGASGYWIRIVNRTMRYSPESEKFPRLTKLISNTVEIIQKETVRSELHEVLAGKADQSFMLLNRPIIDCDVWINELPETPVSKLRELAEADRSRVRTVTDHEGVLTEFWVKWEPRSSLADCNDTDRCYVLDATCAMVRFGDGVRGKIPSYRTNLTVSVEYSFGGGSIGNLPAGAIDGLLVSIPFVERMTNTIATCGGSDEQSIETVRRIGTKRLKHYGRAVTAEDFESLVLEEFNEIAEVKCFAGRGRDGESKPGHVTVVILPNELGNVSYIFSLCKRVEDFLASRAGYELVYGKRLSVVAAAPMKVSAEVSVQLDDYEYAAKLEADIIAEINAMLEGGSSERIGVAPTAADVISTLKKLDHVAYINRILLVGEYYRDNELVTVSLDRDIGYRYFVAVSGDHTVKL